MTLSLTLLTCAAWTRFTRMGKFSPVTLGYLVEGFIRQYPRPASPTPKPWRPIQPGIQVHLKIYIFFPLLLALLVLTFSHSGTHVLATRLDMLFAADSAYTLQGRVAPIPVA